MLFTFQWFRIFFFFLTVYLITSDARSIYEDTVSVSIDRPLNDADRNLFTTLAGYRHRFERSMNFKKLRWTCENLNSTAICDGCDLLVPEVIRFDLKINISKTSILFRCEF